MDAIPSYSAPAPPPPYTRLWSGEHPRLNDIIRIADQELPTFLVLSEHAQRLGGFLRYLLCTDYGVDCTLPDSYTRMVYMHVAQAIRDLRLLIRDAHRDQRQRARLADLLERYVMTPCRELDLPSGIVVQMMLRYTTFLGTRSVYRGCIAGLAHRGACDEIAVKVDADRALLIPALIAPEERMLRVSLMAGMDTVSKRYQCSRPSELSDELRSTLGAVIDSSEGHSTAPMDQTTAQQQAATEPVRHKRWPQRLLKGLATSRPRSMAW